MTQAVIQNIPFSVSSQAMDFQDLIAQYIKYKKQQNQIPFSPQEYSEDDKKIDFIWSMTDLITDLQSRDQR